MKKLGGIKSAKMLTKEVNPFFNTLNVVDTRPLVRAPKGVPHCDCHKANEVHFGRKIKLKLSGGGTYEQMSYHMVPTKATSGICDYCGYVSPLMPISEADKNNKDWRHKCATTTKKLVAGVFTVKGTNVETGETVTFPSAQHAYHAGYGSVLHGLRKNRLVRGWKWERVGGTAKE